MNNLKQLPLSPSFAFDSNPNFTIINNSTTYRNEIIKIQIKNSADFKKELKQKLSRNVSAKKVKPILTRLVKELVDMDEIKVASGLIKKIKKKKNSTLYYYRIRIKGQIQSRIEILLVKLSHLIDLDKIFRHRYDYVLKDYRSSIKKLTTKIDRKYLKGLGKGKIDYDNEKILGLSKVELITLKNILAEKLGLRNVNELYWVALRCGYVK